MVYAVSCGEVAYEESLRWQRLLVAAREADQIDDVLLTLTHPPTYTAGRRADVEHHVLRTPATAEIPLVHVDRGGDVTYHGPGQLVAYPILRLPHAKAVRPYVEALEQAVVATVAAYGVTATPVTGRRTGVWVGGDKIAAIGIRVVGRTTSHGLSLNVDPDLSHFSGIVPCGITDGGVTSLAALRAGPGYPGDGHGDRHGDGEDGRPTLEDVETRLVAELADALGRPVQPARPQDLGLVSTPAASRPELLRGRTHR